MSKNVTYYGIKGQTYENIQQAWDHFHEIMFADTPVDSDMYHKMRKAFLSGCLSSLNVMSTRYNKLGQQGHGLQDALQAAVTTTMKEILKDYREEYSR